MNHYDLTGLIDSLVNLRNTLQKKRILGYIKGDLERIETEIAEHLDSSVPLISRVGNYIMNSGGKRLRPLLMILGARLCGYNGTEDVTLAVVFEYLHAATLLHDDVVDKAELRRGQPAANTIWGNPAVVLIGDYLYSKSILLTVGYQNIRILDVISKTTTIMAEGEVLQLINSDNLEITVPEYLEIITRKTAVLIQAACQVGAIFGGAGSTQEKALASFGENLGLAFQLTDDALDYVGTEKEFGKPIGNDLQEGNVTLPLIHALNESSEETRGRLLELVAGDVIGGEEFDEVKELIKASGGIDYTLNLAREQINAAKNALQVFPESPTKQVLIDIADYICERRV